MALFLAIAGCSGNDGQETTNPSTEVTGPKFDLIIEGSPISTSLDKTIFKDDIPFENTTHWTNEWFQGAALIDENTRIGIRLVDVVDHLNVRLYQHQDVTTIGQAYVDYVLNYNDFQAQDFVEFIVGDDAEVTGFKVHRYYNGGAVTQSTVIAEIPL
ncbi:hypothetical protein D3C87_44960 [compost metagenome]